MYREHHARTNNTLICKVIKSKTQKPSFQFFDSPQLLNALMVTVFISWMINVSFFWKFPVADLGRLQMQVLLL